MNMTIPRNDWSGFVEAIAASVAILSQEQNELIVIAANERFLSMIGREESNIQFPINAKELFPRYVFKTVLKNIYTSIEKAEPVEMEQAFDVHSITHWWRIHLKPIIDTDSNKTSHPVMLTGLDLTDRIVLERELKSSHSRLSALVGSAYDAVISVDQNKKITLFNHAAEDIFGYTKEEIIGKPLVNLIPERLRHKHDEHLERFAESPINCRQMLERGVIYGLRNDGSEFPAEITIAKILVNARLEFTAVIRDITERTRLIDELKQRATTDYLTGLKNRLYFTERSSELISLSNRHKRRFTLAMIDIDNFKAINDQFGHSIGDEVLQAFANYLKAVMRESDIAARIGGEEFVLVFNETGIEAAQSIAERLRATVDKDALPFEWSLQPVPFTISIGMTEFILDDDDNIDKLLNRADKALYQAKQAGKNRVECQLS